MYCAARIDLGEGSVCKGMVRPRMFSPRAFLLHACAARFISTFDNRADLDGYCWQDLSQSLAVPPNVKRVDGEVRERCGTQTWDCGGEVARNEMHLHDCYLHASAVAYCMFSAPAHTVNGLHRSDIDLWCCSARGLSRVQKSLRTHRLLEWRLKLRLYWYGRAILWLYGRDKVRVTGSGQAIGIRTCRRPFVIGSYLRSIFAMRFGRRSDEVQMHDHSIASRARSGRIEAMLWWSTCNGADPPV